MHTANINKFIGMTLDELQKTEEKRPIFCDEITCKDIGVIRKVIFNLRIENNEAPFYADRIFLEEFSEALEAYQEDDKEHALQKFAQCQAAILRIMEKIEMEMK